MSLVDSASVRCNRTAHSRADEESSAVPTLVLPRRGVFRYDDRTRSVVADANTVLLFHPSQPYRITHPTDEGDDCIALYLDPDAVTDVLGEAAESSQAWTPSTRDHRAIHYATQRVLDATDALTRDESAIDVLTSLAPSRPVCFYGRDSARIDAVRERIAVDLHAALSLAELASDAGLSPFHLARRFRAHTGMSLHQYRLALRLRVALTRIRDGAADLTRLALDLGFNSPSHFGAAFRQAFDCTPSEMRARGRVPMLPRRNPLHISIGDGTRYPP